MVVMLVVGSQIRIILPWCLNIAMCALPFFYLGYGQRIMMDDCGENNIVRFLFLGGIYVCTCYFFPNRIAMAINHYGYIPLFIFSAIVGIGMTILLSRAVKSTCFKCLRGV